MPNRQHIELASQLRACAEYLEKYDRAIWSSVCAALDEGNRHWLDDLVGHSAEEMAVKEIKRLYALERSLRLAQTQRGDE